MVSKKQAASIIAYKLNSTLETSRVLLLLSGGSAASLGAQVVSSIKEDLRHNLFITLADERYGPRDHSNSNWLALKSAGLDIGSVDHYIILWEKQISREATSLEFESMLKRRLHGHPKVFAILGIGADGHTAGILPSSPAADEQHHLVADYDADELQRITIAPTFFRRIDIAYLYAEGPSKKVVLDKLNTETDEFNFPAALLRRCGHSVVLYNQEIS